MLSGSRGLMVELAGSADGPALLHLINRVQPHAPWNAEHLRWQFLDPPAGPAWLWVIRDAGVIVALYAAVPQRLRIEGQVRDAVMVQDVMTHPDHRGRGYLHQLGAACLAAIQKAGVTGYTFPNQLSERSFRRLGWHAQHRVPLRQASTRPARDGAALLTPLTRFGPAHARAWVEADVGVGLERDLAYLGWRYRKPGQRYQPYAIAADQGYVVLKRYEATLHICDLVVRAYARALVPDVLACVFREATAQGAERVTAWLPAAHPYADAFDAAGLTLDATHERWVFTTGPGSGASWHLTQGDSDVY